MLSEIFFNSKILGLSLARWMEKGEPDMEYHSGGSVCT